MTVSPTAVRTWKDWSCTVRVVVDSPHEVDDAAAVVRGLMERVDAAVSRFRSDSELSRCNVRAGRPVLVGKLTAELIRTSLDVARATDGLVDPTVGRHLLAAGYDRDISELRRPEDGPLPIRAGSQLLTLSPAAWSDVRLDEAVGLVIVPEGRALDLGASAKAWTVDQAVQAVAQRCPGRVLVEIGGDVAVANAADRPFLVRVAEREGESGELVALARGALATSTTQARRWRRGTDEAHHLIDPRTGAPAAGGWRTVSVWAPSALEANAASTAAVVVGDDAASWLSTRGLVARLVDSRGSVSHTIGWPTPEDGAA
jgi:thiamine biosynthesis lipoprotein